MIITDKRKTPDNKIWYKMFNLHKSMMMRCYNKNNKNYAYYGAKGVYVRDDWHDLYDFIDTIDKVDGFDLENILNGNLQLDKDIKFEGNKEYSYDNCMFVDKKVNNMRKTSQRKFVAVTPNYDIIYDIYNREEFCRKFELSSWSVYKCLNGILKTTNGWQFWYQDEFSEDYIIKKQEYVAVDKDANVIKFNSIKGFSKTYNIKEPNVYQVLSGRLKSIKGYRIYKLEEFSDELIKPYTSREFKGISPDGEIFIFNNISKFAKECSLSQSNISQCLSGKKTSYRGWTFTEL